jgi:bifunctional DNA-binding transcriptional regulator/antitoxin component of YhaV-PrlF toxin-antitoxin module
MEVEIKGIDEQGRIILPKNWRKKYLKTREVIVSTKGDIIEIKPFTSIDLSEYFDKIEVDLKSDLSDWHEVRRELRGK